MGVTKRTADDRGADGRVTITQVAALAGVSPTTVSHVLSGKRIVAAETRGTVHEAIKALGYRPNGVARSLAPAAR